MRLGVYEVTAQIGEGSMGHVYRATDTRLKRTRFLVLGPLKDSRPTPITVVLNWTSKLK
jgi:serine/threonine protein kinase